MNKLVLKITRGTNNPEYKLGDYDLFRSYEGSSNVPITLYRVNYFRKSSYQEPYYKAEIEYYNQHMKEKDSPYVRKGYTTKGLIILKEYLFKKGIPMVFLSINPTNYASLGVAKKARFC